MSGIVAVLDTNIFLNVLNREEVFLEASSEVLRRVDAAEFDGITSVVTVAELCAGYDATNDGLARDSLLRRLYGSRGLRVLDVDRRTAELAGSLRAEFGLALPDAIVAATGITHGATHVITHDDGLAPARPRIRPVTASSFLRMLRP
ncbi:MAG: PIN domain-containing protein [Euryarchaeota archaeon]|nr:PIN domain-containing protein [Euryarchaeota archaeon]MDE1835160.1 PIN domain-containing protein [Euryarchaeota archaeon]MDE1880429.1 PIN domain-containing protein [Euryarchaeota archaeon]MDE2045702.1 PIN domain-containing protein [Thermoplasmata archaeon]